MTIKGNSFTDYASGIQVPNCSKLIINWQNDNDVTIFWHDIIVKFFWRCFVCLVKFSYSSTFHDNIITGSGVMIIFFYKELTRNLEIRNTPLWFLPNIWRLREVRDTNLLRMSLIKCYWMFQNAKVTAVTVSELLRKNQQGWNFTRGKASKSR